MYLFSILYIICHKFIPNEYNLIIFCFLVHLVSINFLYVSYLISFEAAFNFTYLDNFSYFSM